MRKLSALVNTALESASEKIASTVDASAAEAVKAAEAEKRAAAAAAVPVRTKEAEKRASVITTAAEAVKVAEVLEHLAVVMPKLAEMGTNRGGGSTNVQDRTGPEILTSPDKGVTKDTMTSASSIPAQRAHSGGGPGHGMHIETNKNDAPWSKSKSAAEEILTAKIAQSNALLAVGRAKEATELANTARTEFETAKKAYEEEDASTKTPHGNPKSLATNRNQGDLPVPTGPVRDNAGMISMTKRDAKTKDVRAEAGKHVSETALSAKTDKGLSDNLDHIEGAKIASILDTAAARKAAATAA
jgi:hypothetical protein